ncbi:MAG: DUF4038 domain-containing protein [Clostridia bacterium]|nr:DUF4038 domain-containing protein [Clostridia bacterium]
MKKMISFFLSVIIAMYSGAIQSEKSIQSFFDSTGLPYCFAGRAYAKLVRSIEAKKQVYPEPSGYTKKIFADDTGADFAPSPEKTVNAQTWVVNELTYVSEKSYADPFNDVDVDLILAGNGVKYTIPAFWNGGNIWKMRFVCPSEGEWKFRTVCTDETNADLNGRTGKVNCTKYDGELEIYRHGFVTTSYGKKYMTYDDGTPFFYLGDTHWSLGDETQEMVKIICDKRAEQGFTVFQSEPIGAAFEFADGITEADMAGLADYDAKFKTIADAGLVHANAEFFFPASMQVLINNMGGYSDKTVSMKVGKEKVTAHELSEKTKSYLEKISRYWVARYGAYPVMWTLGQEVDNDFYSNASDHPEWNFVNNPYRLVAEYIDKYDAYSHPLTAHQENAGGTTAYGGGKGTDEKQKRYTNKDTFASAFRDVESHSWYAAQWSPSLTKQTDCKIQKDYWYNSQGKPVVDYEGRYCYLWTKNYGSRMQGWAAYLSGMFGYGWGAHDTWSYLNIYDEDKDSNDGIDVITSQEKINATWQDALEYPSAYQTGYTKKFFTSFDWWNLVPRFNDSTYFLRAAGVYSYTASNADNSEMVIYFYSFSDKSVGEKPNANEFGGRMTGRIGCLEPSTVYRYKWFNPQTGEFSEEQQFTSTAFGTYSIGERMWNGQPVDCDMVFYMYK